MLICVRLDVIQNVALLLKYASSSMLVRIMICPTLVLLIWTPFLSSVWIMVGLLPLDEVEWYAAYILVHVVSSWPPSSAPSFEFRRLSTHGIRHVLFEYVARARHNSGPGFSGICPVVRKWSSPNSVVVSLGPNGGAVT